MPLEQAFGRTSDTVRRARARSGGDGVFVDDARGERPDERSGSPDSDVLRGLIEQAYRVFSGYSLRGFVDVCVECCVSEHDYQQLLTTPLRQVSSGLLQEFNDTAQSREPSLEQFKYFMPRYFDHIAALDYPSMAPQLALHRLAPFGKEDFSEPERRVLDAYFVELFRIHLHVPSSDRADAPMGLDELLAMLLYSRWDLAPIFAVWERSTHLNSVLHLCHLIVHEVNWCVTPPVYTDVFADQDMSTRLLAWLISTRVRAVFSPVIESLLLESSELDDASSDLLNWAYEALNPSYS